MMIWDNAFAQPDATSRIELVRVIVGVTIFFIVLSPSYRRFYTEAEPLLYPRHQAGLPALGRFFGVLRVTVMLSALFMVLGIGGFVASVVLLISFGLHDRYVASLTPRLWNNVFHVHVFLLCVCIAQVAPLLYVQQRDAERVASFALTTMKIQVGLVYLLAGLSKLRTAGVQWYTGGNTLLASTIFRGTEWGRRVVAVPELRRSMAVATAAFELCGPFLLLWPRMQPWFVIMALVFHMGVMAVMRISFWHLWIFFPAIF